MTGPPDRVTDTPLVLAKAAVALLLALVAGWVDGVGYVLLFKLFTAHMSGNSIAAAVGAGEGDWATALRRAFPIPVFVAGVVSGTILGELLARRGCRPTLAVALLLEAALLVAFVFASPDHRVVEALDKPTAGYYLVAALPVLAMGVQSAALRRVGGTGVRTTYITGMLTNFAEELVAFLFWWRDAMHGPAGGWLRLFGQALRQAHARKAALYLGIWTNYVAGAVVGTLVLGRAGPVTLLGPVATLAGVAAWDFVRPFAAPSAAMPKEEWSPG